MTDPRTITFTVLGRPQPAGSKRAITNRHTGRVHVIDAAKGSRAWKQEIAGEARRALVEATEGDQLAPLLTGPLRVHLCFVVGRPRSHYGTGRNADKLKDSAPAFPAVRPDVDKLSRAVLDGMTGSVYRDDGQIVSKVAVKEYGELERVTVSVTPLIATVGGWRAAHEFELVDTAA